jgi:hypothetical protein
MSIFIRNSLKKVQKFIYSQNDYIYTLHINNINYSLHIWFKAEEPRKGMYMSVLNLGKSNRVGL